MIRLLVGLGNPGNQYANTRHNIGVWLIQEVVKLTGIKLLPKNKFYGLHAKIHYHSQKLHIFVPTTYMNDSGQAVRAISHFYGIPVEKILIVHDDLDLSCGDARFKKSGGHGGHNGLHSIIQHVKTKQFKRIRIGIGRPQHRDQVVNYVLNSPGNVERIQIENSIKRIISKLPDILAGEIDNLVKI